MQNVTTKTIEDDHTNIYNEITDEEFEDDLKKEEDNMNIEAQIWELKNGEITKIKFNNIIYNIKKAM